MANVNLSDVVKELKDSNKNDDGIKKSVEENTESSKSLLSAFTSFFNREKKIDRQEENIRREAEAEGKKSSLSRGGASDKSGTGILGGIGKGLLSAGAGLAGVGLGIGGLLAGIGAGAWAVKELGGPGGIKDTLTALAEGLNSFNAQSLLALGAVAGAGAVMGAAGKGVKGAVGAGTMLGAFGLGLGGFVAGLSLGIAGATALSSPDQMTSWLTALSTGLSSFDTQSLLALGTVAAVGAAAGVVGKAGSAAVGSGTMLGAFGLGLGGFIAALSLGIAGASALSSPSDLVGWLTALSAGLNSFDPQSLKALGAVAAVGAVATAVGIGGAAAVGAGLMLTAVGAGMGGFIAALSSGIAVADFVSSPETLTKWMSGLAVGFNELGKVDYKALMNSGLGLAALGGGMVAFFGAQGLGQLQKTIFDTADKLWSWMTGQKAESTEEKMKNRFSAIADAVKPLSEINLKTFDTLAVVGSSIGKFTDSLNQLTAVDVDKMRDNVMSAMGTIGVMSTILPKAQNGGVWRPDGFAGKLGFGQINFGEEGKGGLLNPNLKLEELNNRVISVRRVIENISPQQPARLNTQLDSPALSTKGGGGGGGAVVIDGSSKTVNNTSVNNSSQGIVMPSTPSFDSRDPFFPSRGSYGY